MVSVTMIILFIFVVFTVAAAGEKKKSINKIIIHVPYKIHKHHHTHTKYKVITIPAPKKENTVIYLKEEIQPFIKEVPQAQTEILKETQPKTPEAFLPPHQESAAGLLNSIANHKKHSLVQTDQKHEYSSIVDDQKSLESNLGQHTQNFVPDITYRPMILPSHENHIPSYTFKPSLPPQQHAFTHNFIINPVHDYDAFLPKYSYHPMFQFPQGHFNPKFTIKPMQSHIFKPMPNSTKMLQDNIAHTSSHIYKTIITPKTKTMYKVKEENQEDHPVQPLKHFHPMPNTVPVPSIQSSREAKTYIPPPAHNFKIKNLGNLLYSNPDYEYEHVGYLIIDGNSKKVVGKNFKDEINFTR